MWSSQNSLTFESNGRDIKDRTSSGEKVCLLKGPLVEEVVEENGSSSLLHFSPAAQLVLKVGQLTTKLINVLVLQSYKISSLQYR